MTLRVVILPQAHADIDRNANWWAENHSVQQALLWSETVYDQIESLAQFPFPESHALSAENDEFPAEIRDKLVGLGSHASHRAIFTVQNNTVYVLAVRHVAQDVLQPDEIDRPPGLQP